MAILKRKVQKVEHMESEPVSDIPKEATEQQLVGEQPTTSATVVDSPEATINITKPTQSKSTSVRSVCAMNKVRIQKADGKKTHVRYNEVGDPVGETRHTLQSYIGMVARKKIPIDKPSWPRVEKDLKDKLWEDVEDTFEISPNSKAMVLKSAGIKWRQFKATLTKQYVIPFIGQKKKLLKPPRQYEFVGRDVWKRFVAQRSADRWLSVHITQSERVRQRKYPHRLSRKGYIGLQEDEMKSGTLKLGEVPDRAILWKKARIPKNNNIVDTDLAEVAEKIDCLMEKKRKGEFQPCGSEDVLTTVLESKEHSGRVRGVGGFVTPKVYFNLPREKRSRVIEAEIVARERQRATEELHKTKQEFMAHISRLEAMIAANTRSSPMVSDKLSCQPKTEEAKGMDLLAAVVQDLPMEDVGVSIKPPLRQNEVDLVEEDDCVSLNPPPCEKVPRSCELAVGSKKNKVAFGRVFNEDDGNSTLHGVPLKPGHSRVCIDGCLQPDALLPVAVGEEMQQVYQAVGSFVAWPQELIIFNKTVKKRGNEPKDELHQLQAQFTRVEVNKNVPDQFKMLYKYATVFMKATGASLQIPCDADVFGVAKTIYLLHENIIAILEFDMIGQAIISAYMAYLQTLIERDDSSDMYAFLSPGATFTLNEDFQSYVVGRLKDGSVDRVFFLPHNQNCHWILIIIWECDIYILNPLPHQTHFPALENALIGAVKTFKAQTGRGTQMPKVKYLLGCPKQPGGRECGYVVMHYMKEIIEDHELSFVVKWLSKSRRSYTMDELNVVRMEALKFIQDYM